MSRARYASLWQGSLLLLAGLATAEAQYPPSSRRTTSAVGTLYPDTASTTARTGNTRQLVCRGGDGVQVTAQQDPSPRNPNLVAVSLPYRRNPKPAGLAYDQLEPGACSWNPLGDSNAPAEPGIVHFDLARTGSEYVPDATTFPLWLRDPRHYWVFYVDDLTNVSISHGAYGGGFRAEVALRDKPTRSRAASLRRERLRCRGGSGLAFQRGEREGANLVGMRLRYQVAFSAAGPVGKGLEPGTCAWADRTDAREEPGRIEFTTAGNAQLAQTRSGSAVDRSPTAAERWPDVHTIPAYMTDPAHYWTFAVSLANPDSALRHNAWLPSISELVTSTPPSEAPTTVEGTAAGAGTGFGGAKPPAGTGTSVSLPGGSTVGDRYTPGSPSSTSDVLKVFDIRNVQVTSGLEGVSIRFEAAPNLAPTVTINTAAPTGASGSYRFDGQPLKLIVQGTPSGTMWRYSAASNAPLARGTRYWFIADAPEGPNSRPNQATGEFRTLAQRVKVGISDITVISDGDPESPGDLWFTIRSCPDAIDGDLAGSRTERVQWSEGRHRIGAEVVSSGASAPDRLRLFIVGVDDDEHLASSYGSSHPFFVWFHCNESGGSLEPRATSKAEWNAVVIDLDLRQYPGSNATQPFVRRSQPLGDGSKVAFEVHGAITVTRE